MATASQVINRALKRLRVIPSGGSPTSAETTDCLEVLNDMLAAWGINGIDLAHITLASGDTLDVPDDHIEPITLNLAKRLMGLFGTAATLSPEDLKLAIVGEESVRAYHFTIADLTDENPLSRDTLSTYD